MAAGDNERVSILSSVLSRLGIHYRDLRSGTGFTHRAWQEMGYRYEDLTRDAWLEKVHPDDRHRVSQQFSRHVKGKTPEFQCEYRLRSTNGEWRWFISSGIVEQRDADGGVTLLIQNESPGKDRDANWLPAPKGPFAMYMRLYWPKEEALQGKWTAPPLQVVK